MTHRAGIVLYGKTTRVFVAELAYSGLVMVFLQFGH